MSRLKLHLFGSPIIEKNGITVVVDTRKATALIAFLAVSDKTHRRDVLSNLLWPDYDSVSAARNLRRTLWALKKAVGKEWICADRRTVTLNNAGNLWIDVNHFFNHIQSTRTHSHSSDQVCALCETLLKEAVACYQGEFMAGFHLRDSHNFETWQSDQRERLHQTLADTLGKLAGYHALQGDGSTAVTYLQRWLALDPLDERGHVQLMKQYAQNGRKVDAVRQYEQCRQLLQDELGIVPQPETTALYQTICLPASAGSAVLTPPAENQPLADSGPPAISLDTVSEHSPLPVGSSMPLATNPLFVGHENSLLAITRALFQGMTVGIGQTVVITGMGGIGKTQLAVEFAYRYGCYFSGGIFWLNMSIPENIPAQIAACGGIDGLNLRPDFDELPLHKQTKLVQHAWRQPTPRLLIFDDCQEEALLTQWRPAHGGCSIILTSRRNQWDLALNAVPIALPLFTSEETGTYLRQFQPEITAVEAADISELLGGLPLALHLAGSYLRLYQTDITAYLSQLKALDESQFISHPSLEGQGVCYSPTGNELHVAQIFMLSFTRLDPDDPLDTLALALWVRAACFAPSVPFPKALLFSTLVESQPEKTQLNTAVERLIALGLMQTHPHDRLSLHQLLAKFAKGLIDASPALTQVENTVIKWVYQSERFYDPALITPWQTHLHYLTMSARPRQDQEAVGLLGALGGYLMVRGDYEGAKVILEQARAVSQQSLGLQHPQTAAALDKLGTLCYWMGAYNEAKPILEEALSLREAILGNTHPDVVDTLNNLGLLLYEIREIPQATTYLEQALTICEEALPPAHLFKATTLNNLGMVHAGTGHLQVAKSYYQRALAIRQKRLRPDHPLIANSLANIGVILKWLGQFTAALPYYEQALAICQTSLGDDHPYTAVCLNNLSSLQSAVGNLAEARQMLAQALTIRKKVLGDDHPLTASTLNNLGRLLLKMHEPAQARPYIEQALAIREKVLGTNHPNTANSFESLGLLLMEIGDLVGAQICFEKSLTIHEKLLEPNHLQLGSSYQYLGNLFRQSNNFDGAQACLEKALTIRRQSLGPEHLETGLTLYELGLLCQAMKQLDEAKLFLEQALHIFERSTPVPEPQTTKAIEVLVSLDKVLLR